MNCDKPDDYYLAPFFGKGNIRFGIEASNGDYVEVFRYEVEEEERLKELLSDELNKNNPL